MKRFLLLGGLLFVTLSAFCQSGNVKDERITYLWDVTLSMQGKAAGCPDIWEEVKDAIIQDIRLIDNDRTEIVVVPFQHKALDTLREYATSEGKERMIRKIKDYVIPRFKKVGSGFVPDPNGTTWTFLAPPLQYCIDNIFTPDKVDVLKFMTDGVDEAHDGKYEEILRNWCKIAVSKDVYGYYIILTEAAQKGKIVLDSIKPCRFVSKKGTDVPSFNSLIPQKSISFNVRDDYGKPIKIKFAQTASGKIPDGYKVRVTILDNSYIEFDSEVTLRSDNSVEITPKYLKTKDQMITEISTVTNERLIIKTSEGKGMNDKPYDGISIFDDLTSFEIINKPEKTVRFYVKDK